MLADLQNLPSRGILPAAGSVVVCSRAPNYVAAHSTEPAQIVHQDPTNPLVRQLKLRKSAGKNASRKRKGSPAGSTKRSGKVAAGSRQDSTKGSPPNRGANDKLRIYSRLELGLLSLKGLQDALRVRGAPVSGRKAELVQRLENLQRIESLPKEAAQQEAGGAAGSGPAAADRQEGPIVLSDDEAEEI